MSCAIYIIQVKYLLYKKGIHKAMKNDKQKLSI